MSKMKNAEFAEVKEENVQIGGTAPGDDDVPDFGLDVANVKEAKLGRTWFAAKEGFPGILYFVPIERSVDVSSLYEGLNNDPKYVWACYLAKDVKKSENLLFEGKDNPVDVKRGEVFFMFEPVMLKDKLAECAKSRSPMAICAAEKRMIDSRKQGKRVPAWRWQAWVFPKPLAVAMPAVLLPHPEAPMLPEHASPSAPD